MLDRLTTIEERTDIRTDRESTRQKRRRSAKKKNVQTGDRTRYPWASSPTPYPHSHWSSWMLVVFIFDIQTEKYKWLIQHYKNYRSFMQQVSPIHSFLFRRKTHFILRIFISLSLTSTCIYGHLRPLFFHSSIFETTVQDLWRSNVAPLGIFFLVCLSVSFWIRQSLK